MVYGIYTGSYFSSGNPYFISPSTWTIPATSRDLQTLALGRKEITELTELDFYPDQRQKVLSLQYKGINIREYLEGYEILKRNGADEPELELFSLLSYDMLVQGRSLRNLIKNRLQIVESGKQILEALADKLRRERLIRESDKEIALKEQKEAEEERNKERNEQILLQVIKILSGLATPIIGALRALFG